MQLHALNLKLNYQLHVFRCQKSSQHKGLNWTSKGQHSSEWGFEWGNKGPHQSVLIQIKTIKFIMQKTEAKPCPGTGEYQLLG